MFKQWNKLSEDNQIKLIIVLIAAMLTPAGYFLKNWMDTQVPLQNQQTQSVIQAPMMSISGADSIENDVHIINFNPPNNIFLATLKNTGDTLLEFEEHSFPDEFFFLTLWDSKLNIPAHSKLDFRIIFKNSVPDHIEYPFELTYNNKSDKVKMLIRITGDWHTYLQNQLDQFNKKIATNASPQQYYKVAKEALAQNNKNLNLNPGLKEALIGQFLTQLEQPKAAAIAYFNSEQVAPTLVERFVNTPQVIKALAKIYKTNGDYKKAKKWYNIAANQGDIEAQINLRKLYLDNKELSTEVGEYNNSFKAPLQKDIQELTIASKLPKQKNDSNSYDDTDVIKFLLAEGRCPYCKLNTVDIRTAKFHFIEPIKILQLSKKIGGQVVILKLPIIEGKEMIYFLAKLKRATMFSMSFLLVKTKTNDDYMEFEFSGEHLKWAELVNAKLRGADLRYADLRWADLRYADLRGANLRGANLRGADLRGADLRGADLREADLKWAYLSEAHLSRTDLREADLRRAFLKRAKIGGVYHRGANLREADLRGAKFSETDLSGVIPE